MRGSVSFPAIDPNPSSSRLTFHLSRRITALLFVVMTLPWALLAGYLLLREAPPVPAAPSIAARAEQTTTTPSRAGPWGDLESDRIVIEPPMRFVTEEEITPHPLRWVFPEHDRAQLRSLWQEAGLDQTAAATLERSTIDHEPTRALIVTPPADLVRSLSPIARERIYSTLSRYRENPLQSEPFRFRADAIDEWFANSSLTASTIEKVKPLLYRRGASVLFSDPALVLDEIRSRAERTRLILTLARKSTLLVSLRVAPGSDTSALEAYWSRGPRSKDVGALLSSLASRSEATRIDIAHLLPRFARARLFTYPEPEDTPDQNHDCHWTSLNFFNIQPDERFAEAATVEATLKQDYAEISDRPAFGDILLLTRGDNQVVHSCVFIADDVVFTKNGYSATMPWMLMSLPDVVAFYPAEPALSVRTFRARSLIPAGR